MVKGKKITKRQLKEPDEFVSFTEKAFTFVTQYSKRIGLVAIAFLIVIVALAVFQMGERKKNEEAAKSFGIALAMYERGAAQPIEPSDSPGTSGSSSQDLKEVLKKFDEIIAKYPRTSLGKLSLLYRGNILSMEGAYDEAIKAYLAFSEKAGSEKLYRSLAWEGLGHAYEGKKDYVKALEAYQRILEKGEGYQIAEAHLSIGYCYEKSGKSKEAIEHFKAFLIQNQGSTFSDMIARKISLLERG